MKKITLKSYSLPDRENTYSKNHRYCVLLRMDGGMWHFDRKSEVEEFLRDRSGRLTDILFQLNESFIRALMGWRLLWFYSDNSPQALDHYTRGQNLVNQIERLMDRVTHWNGQDQSVYVTRDLTLIIENLTELFSMMRTMAQIRSQWADSSRYKIENQALRDLASKLEAIIMMK